MPTVHRIVNTLLDHGYVVRDDDDRYHLGIRLYELGMRVQVQLVGVGHHRP